jgi:excisionase family DNA binding protein
MHKRYVGIKDVSEYTSLPVKTLYDWAGQGRVPSIKIGRRVLFDLHDIDVLMAELKREEYNSKEIISKFSGDI